MANAEMQREFVANPDKPVRPKAAAKPLKRTPIASVSAKQKQLNARWSFIRACFLLCQIRTDGYNSCMECGLVVEDASHLDLDHIDPRGKGGLYTPGNAMFRCNFRSRNGEQSCHSRKHGIPQWSGNDSQVGEALATGGPLS